MKMLASRVCLAGGVLILATTVSAGQAFADKEGPSKRGHGHSTENAEGAEPEKGVGGAASRLHSHRPIALPPPATVTQNVSRAGPSSAGVPAPVTAAPRQATTPALARHLGPTTPARHLTSLATPRATSTGIQPATTNQSIALGALSALPATPQPALIPNPIPPAATIDSPAQSPIAAPPPEVPIRLAAGSTGTDSSDTANAALAIGIVALALAIAALVLAGLALRKRKGASDTVTADNSTHGWLSVSQAAGALGVPSHAVLRQIQSGELQAMYATTGKRKGLRVRVARRGELVDKPTDEHAQVPTPTTGPSSGANTNAGWLGLDQAVRALGVPREVVLRRIQTGELKATYSTTGKRKGLRVITAGGFVEKPTGDHIAVPARAAGPTAFHGRSGGWLSLDEAVRALGVPREVVLRQIQTGALEAIHSNKGPRKGLRVKVDTPSSSLVGNGS